MSYKCDICGKNPAVGNKRSHSNIKTRTRWLPNLQNVKVIMKGTVKKIKICTSCLRSGKVVKAPSRKQFAKTK